MRVPPSTPASLAYTLAPARPHWGSQLPDPSRGLFARESFPKPNLRLLQETEAEKSRDIWLNHTSQAPPLLGVPGPAFLVARVVVVVRPHVTAEVRAAQAPPPRWRRPVLRAETRLGSASSYSVHGCRCHGPAWVHGLAGGE